MIAAASPLVMPFLPALALRLTVGRRDEWVRHHTTEALNGQVWLLVLWNGFLAPSILSVQGGGSPPSWASWCIPVALASWAAIAAMAIMHIVQVQRVRWWRYPLPFRVVPGSVRRSG